MQVIDKEGYILGLEDAIKECAAELLCVDMEYADSEIARKAAHRGIKNCIVLIQDMLNRIKE